MGSNDVLRMSNTVYPVAISRKKRASEDNMQGGSVLSRNLWRPALPKAMMSGFFHFAALMIFTCVLPRSPQEKGRMWTSGSAFMLLSVSLMFTEF